jgi:hypothetical protein
MSLPTVFRFRTLSRFSDTALILAALLVLPGCWVMSINPLYEEHLFGHSDPDLTFDQNLVGSWWQPKEGCLLKIAAADEKYAVEYVTPKQKQGEGCALDEGQTVRMEGRLVKLDAHRFLDVAPRSDDVCFSCLPMHQIYLMALDKDSLTLTPIDGDWLKQGVEQNKVVVATLPDDNDHDSLAATTKDLKDFYRRYADDQAAFKPVPNLAFKRKPAS